MTPPSPDEPRVIHQYTQLASWQGPVPPPEILGGYAGIIENGPERLFKQFELEAEHRRDTTRRQQKNQLIVHLTGRGCALTFALGALAVAAFALYLGHEWAASIIGGGPSPWWSLLLRA